MNPVEKIVSSIYAYRSYRVQHRNLNHKLSILKSQGRLRENPSTPMLNVVNRHMLTKGDLPWFDYFFSINGIPSDTYIPLRPYYMIIEPTLNHRLMVSTIKDKNFYEQFLPDIKHPKVYLRRINRFYYNREFTLIARVQDALLQLKEVDNCILKASLDSGGGQSIFLFVRQNGELRCGEAVFSEKFLATFKHDFVIQEVIRQHQFYRQLNPSSNNTIRILVYRSVNDDSLVILHTLLRIGAKGHYLDHDNQGGVSVYVDMSGRLASFAYDGSGNAVSRYNGIEFSRLSPIPFYQEFRHAALEVASRIYYGRLLALDFTVSETGEILLLDINCWRNGISHYQMNSGTLFGDYTQEVFDHCRNYPGFNIVRVFS